MAASEYKYIVPWKYERNFIIIMIIILFFVIIREENKIIWDQINLSYLKYNAFDIKLRNCSRLLYYFILSYQIKHAYLNKK